MPFDPVFPPLLTADIPGIGGRIKVEPDDFQVEEVPSYEPCGTGEHLYLWLEKRGVGSEHFTRVIANALGVPVGSIGVAGLKDRYAITRQWVSVPHQAEAKVPSLNSADITVLKTARHTNKLKTGHLRGNKFTVVLRDVGREREADVQAILGRILEQGLPNYYGMQRFGRDGGNIDLGFRCLFGTQPKRLRPFVYKFALSALQSFLFNDYLSRRMQDGLYRTVLAGEVMAKWPVGGLFVAEDVAAEQHRFNQRETVTAGPMFGKQTFAAAGIAAEREATVLKDHQLSRESFQHFGQLMGGTRRHNLVYLEDLTWQWQPTGLQLSFTLPSGCYATVLLRELMKDDHQAEDDEHLED